jgi:hypothetical protein
VSGDKKIDEFIAKQKIDFDILQKTLKSKLETATDEMHSRISDCLTNLKTSGKESQIVTESQPTKGNGDELAESFGAKKERDMSEKREEELSPFAKVRSALKESDLPQKDNEEQPHETEDEQMADYRMHLKKIAQKTIGEASEPAQENQEIVEKSRPGRQSRDTSKGKTKGRDGSSNK